MTTKPQPHVPTAKPQQTAEWNPMQHKAPPARERKPTHLMHQIQQRPEQPERRVVPSCPRCAQSPRRGDTRPDCITPLC